MTYEDYLNQLPDLPGPAGMMANPYSKALMREAQTASVPGRRDLTLRDEANAITIYAFRNTFLEDLHASWRITDPEMKKLNVQTSAKLAHWLYLRDNCRSKLGKLYFAHIDRLLRQAVGDSVPGSRRWERESTDWDLPADEHVLCSVCKRELP